MIKASHLRIGNFIKNAEHEIKVISHDFPIIAAHPWNFSPIPLTEEWFIKFGFELDTSIMYSKDTEAGRLSLYVENDSYLLALENPDSIAQIGGANFKTYNYPARPITDVHELQNMYFAITGQELIIKETV